MKKTHIEIEAHAQSFINSIGIVCPDSAVTLGRLGFMYPSKLQYTVNDEGELYLSTVNGPDVCMFMRLDAEWLKGRTWNAYSIPELMKWIVENRSSKLTIAQCNLSLQYFPNANYELFTSGLEFESANAADALAMSIINTIDKNVLVFIKP